MNYLRYLIFALLISGVAGTASADKFVLCDYCASTEFAEVAESNSPPRSSGAVLVGDSRRNVIKKFWVLVQYEGGSYVRHAMPRTVSAAENESWLKLDKLIELSRGPEKDVVLPNDFRLGSAYDLPGNSSAISYLSDYIATEHWFQTYMIANINGLMTVFTSWLSSSGWSVPILVVFPDGSYTMLDLTVRLTLDYVVWRFEVLEEWTFDSDGNRIRFARGEYASARGTLNGTNILNWMEEVRRNGIPIVRTGPTGGSRLTCNFNCAPEGTQCTLECVQR